MDGSTGGQVIASAGRSDGRHAGGEEPAPGYFSQVRREVAGLVPEAARRILDVGCGEGVLGLSLLERGALHVAGVEIDPEAASRASARLSSVLVGDVETMALPFEPRSFDCIILADVLEHMRDPQRALGRLGAYLAPSGVVVASIPNVRHYSVLHMLMEGGWNYQPSGILDRTHLRFFTLREMLAMFAGCGLKIRSVSANMDAAFDRVKPQFEGKPRIDLAFGRLSLRELTPAEAGDLFVFQYLLVAERLPEPANG